MNNTETKPKRGSYTKVTEKMRWGAYWFNKEGCNNTTIGKKVWLAREIVRDIVKTIEETNTPLPLKFTDRSKKTNFRSLRQF
ncbi:hypothetical protein A0J61_09147 [Choanephora cucurbitarum]|uniref:Uncharacterized protein n=1 Tax=Choanephora cucurbitarum TaxID=101091 RepID=A0A1C7N1C2_9FUNG|nr:hypothetical protein A0J61_09147 [Choanephora cucurbitarum]